MHESSSMVRRVSVERTNLLLELEDASALIWWQHLDLFFSQAQHLHY